MLAAAVALLLLPVAPPGCRFSRRPLSRCSGCGSDEHAWTILVVLALATFAIKASGPLAVGGSELPDRALAVIGLLAPSLLAALVVVETFRTAHAELGVDARAAGVAAAGAAALVGRSPVVAIVAAAAIAAGLRAVV